MNHNPDRSRKSGFTLIELLVVIAIIAILAAILFPVFAQAREKARAIACLSNQKQIGTGLLMYIQDYDETYPMAQWYVPNTTPPIQYRWYQLVSPYIKNGQVYATTTDGVQAGNSTGGGGVWHCPSFPSEQDLEYGIHNILMPDDASCPWHPKSPTPVVTLAAVDAPADKVLIVEKGQNDGNTSWLSFDTDEGAWTDTVGNPPGSHDGVHYDIDQSKQHDCDYQADMSATTKPSFANYGGYSTMPRYRHNGTTNVIFCDGHAKAFPKGRLNWYRNIYLPGLMTAN